MTILVTALAAIFVLYGLSLMFSDARGAVLAGLICIIAGVVGYDEKSLLPMAVGFGLLWVLRLIGAEKR